MVVAALLLTQLSCAWFPFSCLSQNLMKRLPHSEQLAMEETMFRPDVSVSPIQMAAHVHICCSKQTKTKPKPLQQHSNAPATPISYLNVHVVGQQHLNCWSLRQKVTPT